MERWVGLTVHERHMLGPPTRTNSDSGSEMHAWGTGRGTWQGDEMPCAREWGMKNEEGYADAVSMPINNTK